MSISTPIFWIDGVARPELTKLFPSKAGNPNFAPSAQAKQFGFLVTETMLPNGLNTRVSIGSIDNEGIKINLVPSDDKNDPAVFGDVDVKVNGITMSAAVSIRDKGDKELKDGSTAHCFNFRPRVVGKKSAQVSETWSEVVTVK